MLWSFSTWYNSLICRSRRKRIWSRFCASCKRYCSFSGTGDFASKPGQLDSGGARLVHLSGVNSISKSTLLWWPKPPVILSYGVAVLSVAAAVIIARLPRAHLVSPAIAPFLCAIILSAWFGGVRPALFSVALSLLAFVYYFVSPINSFAVEFNQLPGLILFSVS